MKISYRLISALLLLSLAATASAEKLKALIVDGQNNHDVWPKSTMMMKQQLEATGLFEVTINRTRFTWKAEREAAYLPKANAGETENLEKPISDDTFAPNFEQYDVVVSNFGYRAADWPTETQAAFEDYVRNGGGFVSVHAADNSFGNWPEYNKMIGIGGWGGRTEAHGPYVFYSDDGKLVHDETAGKAGTHGAQHEIPITIREPNHPITKGMPKVWLTTQDECYARLRGPAQNMTILATGKDQSERGATDRHEPILMVIDYGKGRVFHTTLGHDDYSFEGVGFITSFTRGAEWAATGRVTIPIPEDFPTADASSARAFAE